MRTNSPNDASVIYFGETGHTLRGRFRTAWEARGGLRIGQIVKPNHVGFRKLGSKTLHQRVPEQGVVICDNDAFCVHLLEPCPKQ